MIDIEYKFHPIADVFPLLSDIEFNILVSDIKTNGLQQSIILYEGKILDGRNRYNACQKADIMPFYDTYMEDDPIGYVTSANLIRRHLNESQRSMIASKLAKLKHGLRKGCKSRDPGPDTSIDGLSQTEAARIMNVSKSSVERAKTVLDSGDEKLIKEVEEGKKSVSRAAKEVKEKNNPKKQIKEKKEDKPQQKKETALTESAPNRSIEIAAKIQNRRKRKSKYNDIPVAKGSEWMEEKRQLQKNTKAFIKELTPVMDSLYNEFDNIVISSIKELKDISKPELRSCYFDKMNKLDELVDKMCEFVNRFRDIYDGYTYPDRYVVLDKRIITYTENMRLWASNVKAQKPNETESIQFRNKALKMVDDLLKEYMSSETTEERSIN